MPDSFSQFSKYSLFRTYRKCRKNVPQLQEPNNSAQANCQVEKYTPVKEILDSENGIEYYAYDYIYRLGVGVKNYYHFNQEVTPIYIYLPLFSFSLVPHTIYYV